VNALRLILASASPRRSELLRKLDIPFAVHVSNTPELSNQQSSFLSPREICLANAHAKARAVAREFPHALVLGADTEVALGNRVFGKPRSKRQAAAFLRDLSGYTHQVITGVCLLCLQHRFRRSFTETTHVTFHPLRNRDIERYLEAVHALDKAGAYAIQEHGAWIIEHLEGSLSNVIGLPLAALQRTLDQLPKAWTFHRSR